MVKQFGHDDVTALHHADALFFLCFDPVFKKFSTPRACGIDNRFGGDRLFRTGIDIAQGNGPKAAIAFG